MSQDIEKRIAAKAQKEMEHLQDAMNGIVGGSRCPKRYQEHSLQDCDDLFQFYRLIFTACFEQAFRKLYYLSEIGLVPISIEKDLCKIAKRDGYGKLQ